jgi:hypothetical protein
VPPRRTRTIASAAHVRAHSFGTRARWFPHVDRARAHGAPPLLALERRIRPQRRARSRRCRQARELEHVVHPMRGERAREHSAGCTALNAERAAWERRAVAERGHGALAA